MILREKLKLEKKVFRRGRKDQKKGKFPPTTPHTLTLRSFASSLLQEVPLRAPKFFPEARAHKKTTNVSFRKKSYIFRP